MSEYEKLILSFCEELELNINNPKMDFEKKVKLIKSIRSFVEYSIPYEYELENENITLKKENEKYKKIEEQLGIDLITLFKALKNGIYYNPSNEFFKKPTLYYSNYNNCWCFDLALGTYIVRLKDYKKIWWLKGDLENE